MIITIKQESSSSSSNDANSMNSLDFLTVHLYQWSLNERMLDSI